MWLARRLGELMVACSMVVGTRGADTVYKFTTFQEKECNQDQNVCIYGMCCADGDPGIQCKSPELPRWAPKSMELESHCANGGVCMRHLADVDDASGLEAIDERALGDRCVHRPGVEDGVDCSATFVQGDPSSCIEPIAGKPRLSCQYISPAGNADEFGVSHEDTNGIPLFDRTLPGLVQTWVRYCRCPENFYGAMCEMEMDPVDVILYALFSLVCTTWFFGTMLANRESNDNSFMVSRYFRDHLLVAPRPESRFVLSQNNVDSRMLAIAVMVGAFEQLMMVAGVLSRSVAWSKNFVLVDILQDMFLTLIDLFSTLSALILPDNWTTANTFQIQILLALPLPIYGAAEHFKRRNEEQERQKQTKTKLRRVAHLHRGSPPDVVQAEVERERQAEEALVAAETEARLRQFRLTALLPLLVIPVSGCLFKPIVGCNFLATSMNPQSVELGVIQPQHSSARPPPDEELFAPKSAQLQCSYGAATTTYFWLGVCCFLPFWFVALIANTQQQSQQSVFALHTAYRAWHTQLQVCCAMSWRSFSGANPTVLTFLLTTLIAIELMLVWRWQPSNLILINQARLQGSILALLWGLCGCVAAVVNDSTDDTSGILLALTSSIWLGAVGFSNRKLVMALCCCVFDRRLAPAPVAVQEDNDQGPSDGVQVGRLQRGREPGLLSSSLVDGVAGMQSSSSGASMLTVSANEEIVDATAVRGGTRLGIDTSGALPGGSAATTAVALTRVEHFHNPATGSTFAEPSMA